MKNLLHAPRQTTSPSVSKRQHQQPIHINNENAENGQIPSLKKRRMIESSVETLAESSKSCGQRDDVNTVAASSVKELKGWLSGFEKQQKDHYEKNTGIRKKHGSALDKGQAWTQGISNRAKSASSALSAETNSTPLGNTAGKGQTMTPSKSAAIQIGTPTKQQSAHRSTGSSSSIFSPQKQYSKSGTRGSTGSTLPQPVSLGAPGSTPKLNRFKPRVKKDEVKATDEKIASVQKLAEWLQDDPFEQRKLCSIRKGAQVIEKSRAFESDTSVVVAKDKDAEELAQQGSVADRQKWLRSAFKDGDDGEDEEEESTVSEKAKWLAKAFKKKGTKPYATRTYHGTYYDGKESLTDSGNSPVEDAGISQVVTSEPGECQKSPLIEAKEMEEKNSHLCSLRSSDDHSATSSPLVNLKTSYLVGKSEVGIGTEQTDSSNTVVHSSIGKEDGDGVRKGDIVSDHDATDDKENSSDSCQGISAIGHNADQSGHQNDATEYSEDVSVLRSQNAFGSKEGGGVLGVAAVFGGVTKLSSVQRRRLALEQKSKDMRKKADPRSNMLKTTWEFSSSGSIENGKHTKRMVDHSALVPKKTLSDLP